MLVAVGSVGSVGSVGTVGIVGAAVRVGVSDGSLVSVAVGWIV